MRWETNSSNIFEDGVTESRRGIIRTVIAVLAYYDRHDFYAWNNVAGSTRPYRYILEVDMEPSTYHGCEIPRIQNIILDATGGEWGYLANLDIDFEAATTR